MSPGQHQSLTVRVALLNEINDVGIVRPTAAHEDLELVIRKRMAHFVNLLARRITFIMIDDRLCGNPRGGSYHIIS